MYGAPEALEDYALFFGTVQLPELLTPKLQRLPPVETVKQDNQIPGLAQPLIRWMQPAEITSVLRTLLSSDQVN